MKVVWGTSLYKSQQALLLRLATGRTNISRNRSYNVLKMMPFQMHKVGVYCSSTILALSLRLSTARNAQATTTCLDVDGCLNDARVKDVIAVKEGAVKGDRSKGGFGGVDGAQDELHKVLLTVLYLDHLKQGSV